ncbi:Fur family transcriptional regulator [Luteipulveratus sp. YIM 133132]|uniref:Fur family transcriptional regulator n=1 Tax=Luteipulveratus flavus TaxID=3031728 RepID=UPI0023B1C00E|nr:Fur family transcriptional regulator [Luteipulveratus sp. YIM 133132]MDE9364645.1 Fur family transcriptional regulator [Luteipulveratus sp. YIM 133132]
MSEATRATRVDDAVRRLRDLGERVTLARRAVLETLDATPLHLDAEAICVAVGERAPGVHRATIYRSLQSLASLGIVTHTHVPGSSTIYHLAPGASRQAHTHLQCSSCERFFDLPVEDLEPLRATVRRSTGFDIDPGHAALLGTCADCREE